MLALGTIANLQEFPQPSPSPFSWLLQKSNSYSWKLHRLNMPQDPLTHFHIPQCEKLEIDINHLLDSNHFLCGFFFLVHVEIFGSLWSLEAESSSWADQATLPYWEPYLRSYMLNSESSSTGWSSFQMRPLNNHQNVIVCIVKLYGKCEWRRLRLQSSAYLHWLNPE